MKKRRDESRDDLDENFNVAEGEETLSGESDKDSKKDHDEDSDEVSELGQGDMLSGEFDGANDEETDDV